MKFILTLSIFLMAVIIHECSHGWVAWKLGDSTAKRAGRLTLNPLSHIDPIGTILFPLVLLISHSPIVFGWAKPVPVNFNSLKNPKRDMIWVGLAGPAANLLLAIFLSFIAGLFTVAQHSALLAVINLTILINLVLAVFNLLPVPPLDGSRIAMGLLPIELSRQYAKLESYGFLIIFGLLYLGIIGNIIWPIVIYLAHLLGVNT
ncbi:site-2 protease family protein [Candidatus Omnitrophota bacterium]